MTRLSRAGLAAATAGVLAITAGVLAILTPHATAYDRATMENSLASYQGTPIHLQEEIPAGRDLLIQQYMKQDGATRAQAEAMQRESYRGSNLTLALFEKMGTGALGARFDASVPRWEILVSSSGSIDAAKKLAAERGLTRPDIRQADWTFDEFHRTLDGLYKRFAGPMRARGIEILDQDTRILIQLPPSASPELRAEVKAAVQSTKVSTAIESLSAELQPLRQAGTQCNNIWCNPPWRAGERWVKQDAGGFCTSAFPVSSPINTWDNFVLTAGHCIDGGSAAKCSLIQCFVPIGWQYSHYFGNGGDAALLLINHSYPTYGAWWAPGISDSFPTRPVEVPPIGTKVCRVGSGKEAVSEIHCGLVLTTNSAKQWLGPNVYVEHMTISLGGCMQRGYSGGPTLNPNTGGAVGITSYGNVPLDGSKNCFNLKAGSENVGNALLNLGVKLKTS